MSPPPLPLPPPLPASLFRLVPLLFVVLAGIVSAEGEVLAIDLPWSFSDSYPGIFELFIGPEDDAGARQKIHALVALDTPSGAIVEVPSGLLCSAEGWNRITSPAAGDVVVADRGGDNELVQWTPSFQSGGDHLNLTLRKGVGDGAQNVSSIATNIVNNGEYRWSPASTLKDDSGLGDDNDYSLLLWSEFPSRQSVSGFFTIQTSSNKTNTPQTSQISISNIQLEQENSCLSSLSTHGGYYNQSHDSSFQSSGTSSGVNINSDQDTGWNTTNLGFGTTTVSFQASSSSGKIFNSSFSSIITLISESTLGMGLVSLHGLQAARNAKVDMVSLYLGTTTQVGSVVLGGYDESFIDPDQSAVFARSTADAANPFRVGLSRLAVSDDEGNQTAIFTDRLSSPQQAILSYDTPYLHLPEPLLSTLLPLIGNPILDANSGSYFYPTSPSTAWNLTLTLSNTSLAIPITVSSSALLPNLSHTANPLLPFPLPQHQLLLTSSRNATIILGRPFLQNLYIISPSYQSTQYLLSALPADGGRGAQNLIPYSQCTLFPAAAANTTSSASKTGAIVGGTVGGTVALTGGICLILLYLRRRRRRRRLHSHPDIPEKSFPTMRYPTTRYPTTRSELRVARPILPTPSPTPAGSSRSDDDGNDSDDKAFEAAAAAAAGSRAIAVARGAAAVGRRTAWLSSNTSSSSSNNNCRDDRSAVSTLSYAPSSSSSSSAATAAVNAVSPLSSLGPRPWRVAPVAATARIININNSPQARPGSEWRKKRRESTSTEGSQGKKRGGSSSSGEVFGLSAVERELDSAVERQLECAGFVFFPGEDEEEEEKEKIRETWLQSESEGEEGGEGGVGRRGGGGRKERG